jgi:hypothetical protein
VALLISDSVGVSTWLTHLNLSKPWDRCWDLPPGFEGRFVKVAAISRSELERPQYGTVLVVAGSRHGTQSYCGTLVVVDHPSGTFTVQFQSFHHIRLFRYSPARHLARRPTPVRIRDHDHDYYHRKVALISVVFKKKVALMLTHFKLLSSALIYCENDSQCIEGFGEHKYALRSFRDTPIS